MALHAMRLTTEGSPRFLRTRGRRTPARRVQLESVALQISPPPALRRWSGDSAPEGGRLSSAPLPTLCRWGDGCRSVACGRGPYPPVCLRPPARPQSPLHRHKVGGGDDGQSTVLEQSHRSTDVKSVGACNTFELHPSSATCERGR